MSTSRKKKVARKGLLRKKLIPSPLIQESDREPLERMGKTKRGLFVRRLSLLRIVRFLWFLLGLATSRRPPQERAIELRRYLEQRGGIWVKTGQLLAFRRDLLPKVFCDELSKLQDRASAFAPEVARQVVEESLEGPIARFFSSFDPEPIAAATIGQVHRAVLRNGEMPVAVKVKRPDIDETFRRDLAMVRSLVGLLTRLGVSPQVRWGEMLEELDTMLNEELDYRLEAAAGARLRKNVLGHGVYIPKIFLRYCTRKTIVAEYVDGVTMSDYLRIHHEDPARARLWCHENGIKPRRVAFRLYETLQRQIHEENLFHADLHPGNIMLLKNSRVALLDFGAVGSLDARFREQLAQFNQLVAQGSYVKAMQILLNMSSPLPAINVDELSRQMARHQRDAELRTSAKTIPYAERMTVASLGKINKLLQQYMIPTSWDMLKFQRTFFALESSIMYLDPKANLGKFNVRYWRRAHARRLRDQQGGSVLESAKDLLAGLGELKNKLNENMLFVSDVVRRAARVVEPRYLASVQATIQYASLAVRVGLVVFAGVVVHKVRNEFGSPPGRPPDVPGTIADTAQTISSDVVLALAKVPYLDYVLWAAVIWILFSSYRRIKQIKGVYSR